MKTTGGGKGNMKGNSTDFRGLSVCKRGEGSDEVRGQSVKSCQVWTKKHHREKLIMLVTGRRVREKRS